MMITRALFAELRKLSASYITLDRTETKIRNNRDTRVTDANLRNGASAIARPRIASASERPPRHLSRRMSSFVRRQLDRTKYRPAKQQPLARARPPPTAPRPPSTRTGVPRYSSDVATGRFARANRTRAFEMRNANLKFRGAPSLHNMV